MLRFFIFISLISILGVFLLAGGNKKTGKMLYIFVTFLLFLAVMSLRAVWVGADTSFYAGLFRFIGKVPVDMYMEGGFLWFSKMLSYVSQEPQWLFFATGFIILSAVFRLVYKYSFLPALSVLIYACDLFSFHLTGMRQALATAFLVFSFDFIIKKKPVWFLLCVAAAFMFHKSAVIFLIAYPLSCIEINKRNITTALAASVAGVVFFGLFSLVMFYIFPSYEVYVGSVWYGNETKLATIMRLCIASVIFTISYFLYKKRKAALDEGGKFIFNSLLWISLMTVCVFILSFKATLFERAAFYFSCFNMILLPNAIGLVNEKGTKAIFVISVILFFILYAGVVFYFRPEWTEVIPYSFFWEPRP